MYIVDRSKQQALIGEMRQLRRDTENYIVFYHHALTNQVWKSFFPKAINGTRQLGPKLLRQEPAPANIEERLELCLVQADEESAIGLGIEWSVCPEKWSPIMKQIEQHYGQYDRKKLKLFLENLNIDTNRQIFEEPSKLEDKEEISTKTVKNLIWRSRKVRFKRFFVLGGCQT